MVDHSPRKQGVEERCQVDKDAAGRVVVAGRHHVAAEAHIQGGEGKRVAQGAWVEEAGLLRRSTRPMGVCLEWRMAENRAQCRLCWAGNKPGIQQPEQLPAVFLQTRHEASQP